MESLAEHRPHCDELPTLTKRIEYCEAAQALMNAYDLSALPEFEQHLASLEEAAYTLPTFMKIKVTEGLHRQLLNKIPDSEEDDFKASITEFAECIIPGLALFEWSVKSPSLGAILTEIQIKADAVAETNVDAGEKEDNAFAEIDALVEDCFILSLSMRVP